MSRYEDGCPLCELCRPDRYPDARRTEVYFEDEDWVIVDCATCGVPMAVWKAHIPAVSAARRAWVRGELRGSFGEGDFDDRMRKIQSHYHAHWR